MKKILDNILLGASYVLIMGSLWLFGYMTIGLPADRAQDTAYAVESPCYWQGGLAKCLPSSGIYLDNSRVLRLGTDDTTHYVELAAPAGMGSNWILTFPSALSGAGKVLYDQLGDGALSWHDAGITASDLTTQLERVSSKPAADLVCHSNVTLSSVQTCDGQSTTGAVKVLLMGQTDPTENGLYSNSDVGAWTRYPNMASLADLPGSLVTVTEQGGGTSYQDSLWFGTGDGGTTANFRLIPTTASNTQLTASRATVTDSNSHLAASATTSTELGYVSGVTSAIQTQFGNKQPLDATLTSLAAYNTNGLVTQTAADTFTGRTLTGTTNRLDVTNGNGVSGNPTADISSSYVGQSSITTLGTVTTGTWSATTVALNKGGTGQTTKAAAFDALSPMTTAGDIIYGGTAGTGTRLGIGSATTVLHGGASAPAYSAVSLTGDVTGVLPLANGGTNKNMSVTQGGLVWTDSDSQEVSGAGTTSDWALSGGTGAPTFSSTTTTGKFVDGSADQIQMRVQAHSTQTSNILTVEKSDATVLLGVTNTAGTAIKGTTGATGAASGNVGQIIVKRSGNTNCPTSSQYGDMANIATGDNFGAGVWLFHLYATVYGNGAIFTANDQEIAITKNTGNSGSNITVGDNLVEEVGVALGTTGVLTMSLGPLYVTSDGTNTVIGGQASAAITTLYAKIYCGSWSSGTPQYAYTYTAQRIF